MPRHLACIFICAGVSISASPIQGTGTFSSFGSNPNRNNTPFWDTTSSDGANCNVGYFLAGGMSGCGNRKIGTPAAGLNLGAANLEYYSNGGSAAAFTLGSGLWQFRLEGVIAGSNDHVFGYRKVRGGSDVKIFDQKTNVVGNTFSVNLTESVALFMKSDGYVFRSNDATGMKAAAFRMSNGRYYFGFEDRPSGDSDYNDMIMSAQYYGVPEPSTWAMMGLATLTGGFLARQRRKRMAALRIGKDV